jgi:hypothetical protein
VTAGSMRQLAQRTPSSFIVCHRRCGQVRVRDGERGGLMTSALSAQHVYSCVSTRLQQRQYTIFSFLVFWVQCHTRRRDRAIT